MTNSEVSINQRSLFVEQDAGEPILWQDYTLPKNQHLLAMTGEIGPHVVLAERAERLIGAMNRLAHRNMLLGLDVAGNDPELNTEILDRYSDGTKFVLEASATKGERLYKKAQREFWHATGFEALRGTGLTRGKVKGRVRKMWRDFRHEIGHTKVHGKLVVLRRTQEKFLPKDHPLREENRREARRLQRISETQMRIEEAA